MAAAFYLRDLISDFFQKLGPDFKQHKVAGQICVAPVLYCYEHSQIWRPLQTDPTGTQANRFEIVSAGEDAYDRPLPLKTPSLPTNEEFPVLRAKRRPVIVVRVPDAGLSGITGSLATATRPLPMVIPLYSVEDSAGRQKYPSEFLARIQKLEFPEFFFLPADGTTIQKDSIVPLFRMTHVFDAHLEPSQWKLFDELMRVLTGQITFWLTGLYAGDYATGREMLLHPEQG